MFIWWVLFFKLSSTFTSLWAGLNVFYYYLFLFIYQYLCTIWHNECLFAVANEYDPATSLNHYLRATGVSRGTKQMCNEGGCGVCLVTATLYDPLTKSYTVRTVNSVSASTILFTFCVNVTMQPPPWPCRVRMCDLELSFACFMIGVTSPCSHRYVQYTGIFWYMLIFNQQNTGNDRLMRTMQSVQSNPSIM